MHFSDAFVSFHFILTENNEMCTYVSNKYCSRSNQTRFFYNKQLQRKSFYVKFPYRYAFRKSTYSIDSWHTISFSFSMQWHCFMRSSNSCQCLSHIYILYINAAQETEKENIMRTSRTNKNKN